MNIAETDLVACVCEGKCEKTIINILLEENVLIFQRDNLLDDTILTGKYRNPKNFTDKYLTVDYEDSHLFLIIIKDDKKGTYNIKAPYDNKITQKVLIVTSPEIEMLMIHSLDLYEDYQKVKSTIKPSSFLKGELKENVKSEEFIKRFYKSHSLVEAIKMYTSKTQSSNKYETLQYLLS